MLNIASFSKRDPFRCLLSLLTQEDHLINQNYKHEIQNEITEFVYFQTVGNHCTAKFVKELSLLLAHRRRFFCASKDDIAKMGIFDDKENIVGFKWTIKEAQKITDLFNQFAECKSLDKNIYSQTFFKIRNFSAKRLLRNRRARD